MRIVITGTSRGLGRAMIDEFVVRDHIVAGCARSTEVIAELGRNYPSPHEFDVVDLTDPQAVVRWADRILARPGAIDVLINNAAIINTNAKLWEVPVDEFSRVIDTNVNGMFYVIRAFLPAMISAGHGLIVNFSSTWGRTTSADVAPYCASKWAVEGLTQSLAQELPPGLAAVPLNPGVIHTDMLKSCFGSSAASFPEPSDWAKQAVPYILNLSTSDNGQSRTVNG